MQLTQWLRRRLCAEERGAVTILVAIAALAIVGLAALGTDVGRLYLARQRVASAADAAALSGAQLLPDRPAAVQTVQRYLHRNGIDPSSYTVELNDIERTMTVTVQERIDYTFARALGQEGTDVTAKAVARIANLTGYNSVGPLGVVRQDFQLGQQVLLKAAPGTGGTLSPGNYGALALGARGTSSYENNLRYGYSDWLRVGDYVATETGNMAGPTERALQFRIDQDPYSTFGTVSKGSPRILVLPILDSFTVNGRGEVLVVGFAAFYVEQVGGSGNDQGSVRGRFLRYVVTGESDGTGEDFATYTVKLTQ